MNSRQQVAARGEAAGFTIAEVLITMLLLTVVLVGLAALQLSTIRHVTSSKLAGEAMRLAQLVVERYRTMDYDAITSTSGNWNTEVNRDGDQMVNVGVDGSVSGPFSARTMVETPAGGGSKLITVRVSWLLNEPEPGAGSASYRESSVTMALQRYR